MEGRKSHKLPDKGSNPFLSTEVYAPFHIHLYCGYGVMVTYESSKLLSRVRSPLSALGRKSLLLHSSIGRAGGC